MPKPSLTKSSPLLIAAAWAIVVLPTAWGLGHTLQNAVKIFTRPASVITQHAPTAGHV